MLLIFDDRCTPWFPLNKLWLWGKHTMTAHQTWQRIDRHMAPSFFQQYSSFLKRLTNLIKERSRRLDWHETYHERVMYKTWITQGYMAELMHWSIVLCAVWACTYTLNTCGMCGVCLVFTVSPLCYITCWYVRCKTTPCFSISGHIIILGRQILHTPLLQSRSRSHVSAPPPPIYSSKILIWSNSLFVLEYLILCHICIS